MITADFDVSKLTAMEKIALMERLWDELTSTAGLEEPPEWHRSILAEREQEWTERQTVSQDWKEAREELRRDLP